MKKVFLWAALAISMGASAQTKKKAPPPPPPPPVVEMTNTPPPPPEPPAPPPPPALPKEYTDFLERNPSVKSIYWKNETVIIKKKNGEAEKYVLSDQGIRDAEAKYGQLPQAPPPPPPPPMVKRVKTPPPPPKPPKAPKPEKEWQ